MKLTIRIIALSIVFAASPISSHQSATVSNPVPVCGEGIPTCPPNVVAK
jgi:hypothetical protein